MGRVSGGQPGQRRLGGRTREILPPELEDAAFDRYVDLTTVKSALAQLDACALTDAALATGEGERVLQRSRKGLNADQLLEKAADLAVAQGDKESLDRLQKEAERRGNKGLAAQIAAQKRLAGTARAAEGQVVVALEGTNPEAVAELQHYLTTIKRARLLTDTVTLDVLAETLPASRLSEEQQNQVKKLLGEARSAMPKEPTVATKALRGLLEMDVPATLGAEKLSGESRDFDPEQPAQRTIRTEVFSGQEDLGGYGKLVFQLSSEGRVIMIDKDGRSEGSWARQGSQVELTFYDGKVVYTGTRQGATLSGTASNGRATWNWSVRGSSGRSNPRRPAVKR
jgi:hypothetical protein